MASKVEPSSGMNSTAEPECSVRGSEIITPAFVGDFLSHRADELLDIVVQIKEADQREKLADLEAELMEIQFVLKDIHRILKTTESLCDRQRGYEGLRHNFEKNPSAYNLIRTILEARRAGMLEQCVEFLESRIVYVP